MKLRTEEYIFYQGKKFQVEFYFTEKEQIPAKEFLEKIKQQKVVIKLAAYSGVFTCMFYIIFFPTNVALLPCEVMAMI